MLVLMTIHTSRIAKLGTTFITVGNFFGLLMSVKISLGTKLFKTDFAFKWGNSMTELHVHLQKCFAAKAFVAIITFLHFLFVNSKINFRRKVFVTIITLPLE